MSKGVSKLSSAKLNASSLEHLQWLVPIFKKLVPNRYSIGAKLKIVLNRY
jgi:hypothetical protein